MEDKAIPNITFQNSPYFLIIAQWKALFIKDQWQTSEGLPSITWISGEMETKNRWGIGATEKGRLLEFLLILFPLDPQGPHIYHSKYMWT